VEPDAEREFAEYFRARRDAVRRTAFLLCGDWHGPAGLRTVLGDTLDDLRPAG
jgi:hypothetical protein